MRRIRLTVSYDGTAYCGSQLQPNGVTVEEKLNEAIEKLTGEHSPVLFASRTDSGVHAAANVAVFDTQMRMAADRFSFALNQRLPEDIRIRASEEVPLSWHPRKQNCVKTYEYRIYNHRIPDPMNRLYAAFCYYPLDTEWMRAAFPVLLGEHDFAAFCSARSQAENTVRTIYSLELEEREAEAGGRLLTLRVSGSGFLYNMIRILAGTLLQIGSGIRPASDMGEILRSRTRGKAGPVAPACGLTLRSIRYVSSLPPEVTVENEDWSYHLDQQELSGRRPAGSESCQAELSAAESSTDGPAARLTVLRCREEDYDELLKRLFHQNWRNGAEQTLLRDLERPDRPVSGKTYGYYTVSERPGDPEWPFAAADFRNIPPAQKIK